MRDSIHVSKENYLKAILEAEAEGRQVIPAMLAHWLEVSAPAVTMAIKRLKRDGDVEVGEDGIVRLTAHGTRDRLSHRPAPSPDRAHAERDLRHGVVRDPRRGGAAGARRVARFRSQAAGEARRGRRLSARQRGACPRIPPSESAAGRCRLSEAAEGQRYTVTSLHERDPKLLLFLHQTGIGPRQKLRVLRQNYDQTVSIELPTGNSILGRPAAEAVWLLPDAAM